MPPEKRRGFLVKIMVHLTFGKHKGKAIKNMKSIEETRYLHWLLNSNIQLKKDVEMSIKKHLNIK